MIPDKNPVKVNPLTRAVEHAIKFPKSPGFNAEFAVFRWMALGLMVFLMAGCTKIEYVKVPGPVEYRDRLVVQPIDSTLLRTPPIPSGKVSECHEVAAERKELLKSCHASLEIIRNSQ